MENIYLAYALGVLTIVFIIFIISSIRANMLVSRHEKEIEDLRFDIEERDSGLRRYVDERCDHIEIEQHMKCDLLDRRIDGEIDRVNNINTSLLDYIDSKVTKLEYTLTRELVIKDNN